MRRCPKCRRWLFSADTSCYCRAFECCIPDWDDDDWSEQYAQDAEDAALLYTEHADECEYICLKESVVCKVRDPERGTTSSFRMSAETDINYHASEITND
jgi:hypothetical protein